MKKLQTFIISSPFILIGLIIFFLSQKDVSSGGHFMLEKAYADIPTWTPVEGAGEGQGESQGAGGGSQGECQGESQGECEGQGEGEGEGA